MQITTATRTVEIYMNNENGVSYRNVKDGAAYGPTRWADRAKAKAGSAGREILDALDAQAAAEAAEVTEAAAEVVAQADAQVATEIVAEVTETLARRIPLNGTQMARLKALVAAEWPLGTRVMGVDTDGRTRTGTVHRGGDGASWTTGRMFVSVLWDAEDNRGLRRRYEAGFTDSLTRI